MYAPYEYTREHGRPYYALASTQGILRAQRGAREGLPRVFRRLDEARRAAEKLNAIGKTKSETIVEDRELIAWTIQLTPCDQTRRRYTPSDIQRVGEWVLAARLPEYAEALRQFERACSGAYVVSLP